MKGKYTSDDDARIAAGQDARGGTYVDAGGGRWDITVADTAGVSFVTWLAKADDDAGTWFSDQRKSRLFDTIDAHAAKVGGDSSLGLLLVLALLFAALTDKRR